MNVPLLYGVGSLFLLGLSGYAPNNTYYIPSIVCIIIWFISIANPCSILSRMTSCCTEERSVRTEETKENNERGMELFGNVL